MLLGIAFLAGLITALSPCILPVLPILLAGGASGRRPLGIILGLVGAFSIFTVVGASLLDALGLPQDFLRNLAIALLFLLAATLLFPKAAALAERPLLFLTRGRPRTESNGILLGASLGLVFVPCAGPVLGAVTAVSASGDGGFETFLVALAYALGAALPMLAIAVGGRRMTQGMSLLRRHAEATRRVAGVLVGATAIAIALGADQSLATTVPGYTQSLQERVEGSATADRELARLRRSGDRPPLGSQEDAPVAPEFDGISEWINSGPLTLAGLRGKVVLIDFWTYSCVNCLRTLPHLRAWDQAYRGDGLRIVGVHAPEFAFERELENVKKAVRKQRIRYPVALDNDFVTWTAYANEYWPAKYLIDRTGRVRYVHFGEGDYDETERMIRRFLGAGAGRPAKLVSDTTPAAPSTPETYLGFAKLDRFAGTGVVPNREASYRFPLSLAQGQLAYAGRIRVENERIVAETGARLRLRFQAREVNLVLGGQGILEVRLDGRRRRTVAVRGEPRLYNLLRMSRHSDGLLELRFTPGISAYAFTFG
ncbi:MAG TPA: cytochrome c biogenesis protein DipZ [Gaiellaceae bacterium]|nr:cytochrome c biogenesis protein DipZ [Gaiellaceae bacterium]